MSKKALHLGFQFWYRGRGRQRFITGGKIGRQGTVVIFTVGIYVLSSFSIDLVTFSDLQTITERMQANQSQYPIQKNMQSSYPVDSKTTKR